MSDGLITLLREVTRTFQDRLGAMQAIADLKLSPFQARILSVINRHSAISQLALATSTDRDKAQVARAVKELELRGLVTRSAHATDWRTQCLDLTEAGRRVSVRLDQERAELVEKALSDCSASEQDALCRTLQKINRSMSTATPRKDT